MTLNQWFPFPVWATLIFCVRQPREKGRMRFHKLQNVQIALDFLKHRQVQQIIYIKFFCQASHSSSWLHFISDPGQTGEHQEWWYCRWKPEADPWLNMDHHPSLPGTVYSCVRAASPGSYIPVQFYIWVLRKHPDLLISHFFRPVLDCDESVIFCTVQKKWKFKPEKFSWSSVKVIHFQNGKMVGFIHRNVVSYTLGFFSDWKKRAYFEDKKGLQRIMVWGSVQPPQSHSVPCEEEGAGMLAWQFDDS